MSDLAGRGRRELPSPRRRQGAAVAAILLLALAGCASPAARVDAIALGNAMTRAVVHGTEFDHVVFLSRVGPSGSVLHIYIEGDGSPYLDRWTVSSDPTPRRPLMLELMALDPAPAIYIGRPCYFGLAQRAPCTPLDWTLGRFSDRVVASMLRVVEIEMAAGGFHSVELFGHSGGGAIAVLLARRLPSVTRVVTLSGNLDPDAWSEAHRYTPLQGSLNPARDGVLPRSVRQDHYVGDRDAVVPPAIVDAAARSLGADGVHVLPGVAHTSGWKTYWPAILAGQ